MRKSFYSLLGFLMMVCALDAQVVINEFQSSNSSTINDPEFDNSADWIELYNAGESAVDLGGFYLSDNRNDSIKWQLPSDATIEANGYLIVWADGQDTLLHSNFKLSSAGEEVAFFSPTGDLLDFVKYTAHRTNLSQGRQTDGNPFFFYFTQPTPGGSNNTESFQGLTFYRPSFSVRGGIQSNAFELELSSLGGLIRYTTDGSNPTTSSTLYSSPISIDSSTIVRAAVFESGFVPGFTVTQSYFFDPEFEERNLPIVSIAGNSEYFWDPEIGIYVQDFKPEWEYPINVELFENDGSNRAVFNELAGVKVKGLASWRLPQKMLGIEFDNDYENNSIDYPLFPNEARRKFSNFVLRAAGSDWSRALMRDPLGQEISRGFVDVEIQNYRPCRVYINGEYLGIHNIRPTVNEEFVEQNILGEGVEYDRIENHGNVENGDSIAYYQMFNLANSDLSIEGNYEALQSVLDLQSFIDFFIAEIWSSNTSYGHNIMWYKSKKEGAKWRMILADMDRAFFWEGSYGMQYYTSYDEDNYYYIWIRDAFKNMLEQEDFRELFVRRFTAHLYCTYNENRTVPFLRQMRDGIAAEIPYHVERWEGAESDWGNAISSFEFWREKVDDIEGYLIARKEFMWTDLANYCDLGNTARLDLLTYPENAGSIFLEGLEIPQSSWTGKIYEDIALQLEAKANPGFAFEGWHVPEAIEILPLEEEWTYLDNGTEPAVDWKTLGFDDTDWKNGIAPLGYGDSFLTTNISFGSSVLQKHISYYFRRVFDYSPSADASGRIILRLKADDGAVVYLNEEEIARFNFTDSAVTESTFTLSEIDMAEDEYISFFIDASLLMPNNVLAVEVHQSRGNSTDVNFDCSILELSNNTDNLFDMTDLVDLNIQEASIVEAVFSATDSHCFLPLNIEEDLLLEADCSPYFAQGMTHVKSGARLEIEAGVEILFPEEGGFFVEGSMQVNGTENEPVILKAHDSVEHWKNVHFHYADEESDLNYLIIEDASIGNHSGRDKAALTAFHSVVRCENLEIIDVEADPVFTQYSDFYLDGGQLHAKITGDFVNVKYGKAEIRNVSFEGNDQIDTDGIDYDEVEDGIVENCRFENFMGFNSDGLDLGEQCQNVQIRNNFFRNCSDKAVSIGQRSTVVAENNSIVSCQQGFGVKDEGEIFLNKTTTYNVAIPIAAFEKNKGKGGGRVEARNSIFSNSVDSTFLADENSVVDFDYSLSDDEWLGGITNLQGDPLFSAPNSLVFDLEIGSPAAGTGQALSGGSIDMGDENLYWEERPDLLITEIHYHPSAPAGSEFIRIENPGPDPVDMTGYTLGDAVEFSFPADFVLEAGAHIYVVEERHWLELSEEEEILEWESGNLSNGGERILLKNAAGIVIDHVSYDDEGDWPLEADGMGPSLKLKSNTLDNHFGKNWELNELLGAHLVVRHRHFKLFPNPTNDILNLQGENIEHIRIYSSDGRLMLEEAMAPLEAFQLNTAFLPPGAYLVEINGEQKIPFAKIR